MQTYLEKEGFNKRDELIPMNDYNYEDYYSESHEDALSDPSRQDKPLGKGTGGSKFLTNKPDHSLGKHLMLHGLDTINGGGSYDIYGRNGVGGRNASVNLNLYTENSAYNEGDNTVDTKLNQEAGQYVFKVK